MRNDAGHSSSSEAPNEPRDAAVDYGHRRGALVVLHCLGEEAQRVHLAESSGDAARKSGVFAKATLFFIDQNGKDVRAAMFMQGLLDAMIEATKVASNAQFWNAGAPLAEAAAVGALAAEKGALELQKQELETAMKMKYEEASAKVEKINAMADIQKQMVDAAQAAVDIDQEVIVVLQANLKLRNALTSVKNLFAEREKAAAMAKKDPSTDPSFRILRDQQAISLLGARADAQQSMFLAASALTYEINTKVPGLEGAVMNANNAVALDQLSSCLKKIYIGIELTGRGDGALFGLVSGAPTYVARVDVDGLRITNRIDLPIAETLGWAFAHWGGRFYVFTSVSPGHSRIDVLTPGRGTRRVVDKLGFEVVGAGVSPCAPTEIR